MEMENLAVAFTDLHTHNYKQFDRKGSRLENCLVVIDDVYKLAIKSKSRVILFHGDIVDQQQAVPTAVLNALVRRLKKHIDAHPEIIWYLITGNHDQGSKSVYGTQAVSYIEQLAIIFPEHMICLDNGVVQIGNSFVHGIPYYQHPEHYRKALADRAEDAKGIRHSGGVNVLMVHQTPTNQNPLIPVDTDVNDPLYDAFDLVMCGHIHTAEEITPKFFLLGSPLHRDLSDEGKEKGIYLLDLEFPAETLTFVSRKGHYPEFKRHKGPVSEEDTEHFIIPELDIQIDTQEEQNAEHFKSSLSEVDLITNYWKEVDNKDNELLKVGLEFVNTIN